MSTVTTALWKGCLAGIGLAAVFLAISGLAYLVLSQTGLARNIVLFVAIASGPIIGTVGLCAVLWARARSQTGIRD